MYVQEVLVPIYDYKTKKNIHRVTQSFFIRTNRKNIPL
jgi:hypothetical protein